MRFYLMGHSRQDNSHSEAAILSVVWVVGLHVLVMIFEYIQERLGRSGRERKLQGGLAAPADWSIHDWTAVWLLRGAVSR